MTAAISANTMTTTPPALHGKRGCLSYLRRALLALAILIVALPLVGCLYETIMAAGDDQRFPPPGQLINVDGVQMHIHCVGDGSPTIILESGLGGWSDSWSQVQPAMGTLSGTVI